MGLKIRVCEKGFFEVLICKQESAVSCFIFWCESIRDKTKLHRVETIKIEFAFKTS